MSLLVPLLISFFGIDNVTLETVLGVGFFALMVAIPEIARRLFGIT